MQATELFDAEFMAAVSRLRILARRVPRGGRPAEQRSQKLGSGMEFRDFRPYVAGDDIRSIDWNIYRRLGKVVLRLFEEQEDLPLYLLPDTSGSMAAETPPRAHAALRATLALAAVGLGQHDSVGVYPFADRPVTALRLGSGRRRIYRVADYLAHLDVEGGTQLVDAVKRFASFRLRRGLLALVSDFFDQRGIEAICEALGTLRHKLVLIQLVRDGDREPTIRGDVRLVDCEAHDAQDVAITSDVLKRYRDAYDHFSRGLTEFATRRNAGLLRLNADGDVVDQLASLFAGGRLNV